MRMGKVAGQAGVNVQTLRYYERRGLLPEPERQASGYREYDPDTIPLVRFIRRAQELGFTLVEIAELVDLRRSEPHRSSEVREIATRKIEDIGMRINRLSAMRDALLSLVEECRCGGKPLECPILEALGDKTGVDGA